MNALSALNEVPTVVTVLLSGGIDSAAVAAYYLQMNFEVRSLFVDCGQAAAKEERKAAHCLSKYFGIPIHEIAVSQGASISEGEIPGRNAFLIFSVLLTSQGGPQIIALGIHSGVPYYDCSKSFLGCAQVMVDGYAHGRIKLSAPFLKWNKPMIWNYCQKQGLPVDMTYSCETGHAPPCGLCPSCRDREGLYAL